MATAGWVAMERGPVGAKALAETCDVIVVVDVLSFSTSLRHLPPDSRMVLPSPNGSSIAFAAVNGARPVVAGCLRNAAAVARHVRDVERVVPAGERWPDGSLRPAYEDFVGAGAIVDRLHGLDPGVSLTPEAGAAAWAFRALRPLAACPSGAELVDRGFAEDVRIAEEVDASSVVPALVEGRFVPT